MKKIEDFLDSCSVDVRVCSNVALDWECETTGWTHWERKVLCADGDKRDILVRGDWANEAGNKELLKEMCDNQRIPGKDNSAFKCWSSHQVTYYVVGGKKFALQQMAQLAAESKVQEAAYNELQTKMQADQTQRNTDKKHYDEQIKDQQDKTKELEGDLDAAKKASEERANDLKRQAHDAAFSAIESKAIYGELLDTAIEELKALQNKDINEEMKLKCSNYLCDLESDKLFKIKYDNAQKKYEKKEYKEAADEMSTIVGEDHRKIYLKDGEGDVADEQKNEVKALDAIVVRKTVANDKEIYKIGYSNNQKEYAEDKYECLSDEVKDKINTDDVTNAEEKLKGIDFTVSELGQGDDRVQLLSWMNGFVRLKGGYASLVLSDIKIDNLKREVTKRKGMFDDESEALDAFNAGNDLLAQSSEGIDQESLVSEYEKLVMQARVKIREACFKTKCEVAKYSGQLDKVDEESRAIEYYKDASGFFERRFYTEAKSKYEKADKAFGSNPIVAGKAAKEDGSGEEVLKQYRNVIKEECGNKISKCDNEDKIIKDFEDVKDLAKKAAKEDEPGKYMKVLEQYNDIINKSKHNKSIKVYKEEREQLEFHLKARCEELFESTRYEEALRNYRGFFIGDKEQEIVVDGSKEKEIIDKYTTEIEAQKLGKEGKEKMEEEQYELSLDKYSQAQAKSNHPVSKNQYQLLYTNIDKIVQSAKAATKAKEVKERMTQLLDVRGKVSEYTQEVEDVVQKIQSIVPNVLNKYRDNIYSIKSAEVTGDSVVLMDRYKKLQELSNIVERSDKDIDKDEESYMKEVDDLVSKRCDLYLISKDATEKQKEEVKKLSAVVIRKEGNGSYKIGCCKVLGSNEKEYTEIPYKCQNDQGQDNLESSNVTKGQEVLEKIDFNSPEEYQGDMRSELLYLVNRFVALRDGHTLALYFIAKDGSVMGSKEIDRYEDQDLQFNIRALIKAGERSAQARQVLKEYTADKSTLVDRSKLYELQNNVKGSINSWIKGREEYIKGKIEEGVNKIDKNINISGEESSLQQEEDEGINFKLEGLEGIGSPEAEEYPSRKAKYIKDAKESIKNYQGKKNNLFYKSVVHQLIKSKQFGSHEVVEIVEGESKSEWNKASPYLLSALWEKVVLTDEEKAKGDIFVVLGNTRVGKSTVLNHFIGNKLVVEDHGGKMAPLKLVCAPEVPKDLQVGIGNNNLLSETTKPNVIRRNGFVFIDLPGFADLKGFEQKIINGKYIAELINGAQNVRFGLVDVETSIAGCESGGHLVSGLFQQITETISVDGKPIPFNLIVNKATPPSLSKKYDKKSTEERQAKISELQAKKEERHRESITTVLKSTPNGDKVLIESIRYITNTNLESTIDGFRESDEEDKLSAAEILEEIGLNSVGGEIEYIKNMSSTPIKARLSIDGYSSGIMSNEQLRLTDLNEENKRKTQNIFCKKIEENAENLVTKMKYYVDAINVKSAESLTRCAKGLGIRDKSYEEVDTAVYRMLGDFLGKDTILRYDELNQYAKEKFLEASVQVNELIKYHEMTREFMEGKGYWDQKSSNNYKDVLFAGDEDISKMFKGVKDGDKELVEKMRDFSLKYMRFEELKNEQIARLEDAEEVNTFCDKQKLESTNQISNYQSFVDNSINLLKEKHKSLIIERLNKQVNKVEQSVVQLQEEVKDKDKILNVIEEILRNRGDRLEINLDAIDDEKDFKDALNKVKQLILDEVNLTKALKDGEMKDRLLETLKKELADVNEELTGDEESSHDEQMVMLRAYTKGANIKEVLYTTDQIQLGHKGYIKREFYSDSNNKLYYVYKNIVSSAVLEDKIVQSISYTYDEIVPIDSILTQLAMTSEAMKSFERVPVTFEGDMSKHATLSIDSEVYNAGDYSYAVESNQILKAITSETVEDAYTISSKGYSEDNKPGSIGIAEWLTGRVKAADDVLGNYIFKYLGTSRYQEMQDLLSKYGITTREGKKIYVSNENELHRAYRKIALVTHSDKHNGDSSKEPDFLKAKKLLDSSIDIDRKEVFDGNLANNVDRAYQVTNGLKVVTDGMRLTREPSQDNFLKFGVDIGYVIEKTMDYNIGMKYIAPTKMIYQLYEGQYSEVMKSGLFMAGYMLPEVVMTACPAIGITLKSAIVAKTFYDVGNDLYNETNYLLGNNELNMPPIAAEHQNNDLIDDLL